MSSLPELEISTLPNWLTTFAEIRTYDIRLGDAHPTSSKIDEALALSGIDEDASFLQQGKQLIANFGNSI